MIINGIFEHWWHVVGSAIFFKTSGSAKEVSEAAFQYGVIHQKNQGKISESKASNALDEILSLTQEKGFFPYDRVVEIINKARNIEMEPKILWQDCKGNQVWGYVKDGKQTITGVIKVVY